MTIQPKNTMEIVMNKFEISNMIYLPVTENGKYQGFVSKAFVLEAYRTKLKSMVFE